MQQKSDRRQEALLFCCLSPARSTVHMLRFEKADSLGAAWAMTPHFGSVPWTFRFLKPERSPSNCNSVDGLSRCSKYLKGSAVHAAAFRNCPDRSCSTHHTSQTMSHWPDLARKIKEQWSWFGQYLASRSGVSEKQKSPNFLMKMGKRYGEGRRRI